jgi:ABC-type anion transport system duplicated permease subunit
VLLVRLINPETAGKARNRLTKAVVLAIRELMCQSKPDDTTRDLAAFIALALDAIANTIDLSVGAWEKRGYWVKADRFRMDWAWSSRLAGNMQQAVLSEDWSKVAQVSAQVAERLNGIQIAKNHRMGTPWVGAYLKMKGEEKRKS